jgi:hypothetical protein
MRCPIMEYSDITTPPNMMQGECIEIRVISDSASL